MTGSQDQTILINQLYQIAMELAVEAGKIVAAGRDSAINHVSTKTNMTDVVTAMDIACETFVIEQLAARRPGDGVYGEEHGERLSSTGVRWLVDPIDGTVNYLYGSPDYAVSIAAELDGQIVAGAVARPTTGDLFHAFAGGGAYLGDRQLHGSSPAGLDVALVGTGFGYDPARRAIQGQLAAALLPQIRDIRRLGSAALDICYVAQGRADAYYEWGLHLWDYAAASLIAAEAGVSVRVPEDEEGLFLAVAPAIADALTGELDRLIDPSWPVPR